MSIMDVSAGADAPAQPQDEEVFVFPVSFAQQRLWLLDRMGGQGSYGVTSGLRLSGPLRAEAMRLALEEIVYRHEALRTTFATVDGEPVQVVRPAARFPLPVEDIGAAGDVEAEMRRRVGEETRRPFDLRSGPLFRAVLLRASEQEHTLVVSMHHIVSDGWSLGVLFRELSTLYGAFSRGEPSPLPDLPIQFADYAVWERDTLRGAALEERLGWWRDRLSGAPALLELSTDRPRPPAQSHRGARERVRVEPAAAEVLRTVAQEEGGTLFMAVLAAWQVLLSKYSGQDDVVVGTSVAGRTRVEVEGLIGFFVNTLPLRTDLSGDPTFRQLVRRVRETTLGAFARQDLPFDKLVDELSTGRTLGHNPVFQAFMALQNTPGGALSIPGLTSRFFESPSGTAKFDVSLLVWESEGAVTGWLEYATDLFDAATARRMADHLAVLASAIAAGPDRPLSSLTLLSDEERARVLREWNPPADAFPVFTLHGRFQARAAEAPDRLAVSFQGESLSYGELNARANRLARHLRRHGVGPESRVGLCMERGTAMLAGILGIFKAGGAYVPLDPTYPADRLAYMVEDAGITVLVTESALLDRIEGDSITRVLVDGDAQAIASEEDENLPVDVDPEALAYVIYTSGSTGRPKGAMLTHANVARLFTSTDGRFGFGAKDVWTLFHSYAFDFSVWEIWGALLYGGRLVVVPFLVSRSPEQFRALLREEGVTVLNQTPSAFQQLIEADAKAPEPLEALRYVVFGGEALHFPSLRPWLDRYGPAHPRLVNMYGITETCVHVTHHAVTGRELRDPGVASVIGGQLADLRLYVLDAAMHPVPLGVPGELFVAGAGLARGYLG
ncbi:MAG TPA: amino acid adenylation domain-containing protein, partial [Longimicrobium sp.]|uniref:amino acid adenylation domain-containing protein n=1 Tax=Longimicrobium sp. TaxID=2029185 RepID=UPI002EDAFF67